MTVLDLSILNARQNVGYLNRPIPDTRDLEIVSLLDGAIEDGRLASVAAAVTDEHVSALRAFSERMAIQAVRTKSEMHLITGLVALLLSLSKGDIRDGLTHMPLFFDAIQRNGVSQNHVFESVRRIVGDFLFAPLATFAAQKDRSLQSMGYCEGTDSDGFRYVRRSKY